MGVGYGKVVSPPQLGGEEALPAFWGGGSASSPEKLLTLGTQNAYFSAFSAVMSPSPQLYIVEWG